MRDINGLSFFVFLGIILIIVGLILVLLPLISKMGVRLENIHPLILVWKKIDDFYIGTSPITIILLILVYLLITFLRRGYLT
ncbi:MAG: hypothetical protein NZ929_05905 [Aigarchaeota archaeon]|nr:hypothetical protein [Aigarchaeota archaeon]MCX8193263.1 hypothetical protein [Nitrososphaeria archaeon]MDW7986902.1 hypothetical protein [Nitrososphaerota archaeon]